jgi:hypothetical protein
MEYGINKEIHQENPKTKKNVICKYKMEKEETQKGTNLHILKSITNVS